MRRDRLHPVHGQVRQAAWQALWFAFAASSVTAAEAADPTTGPAFTGCLADGCHDSLAQATYRHLPAEAGECDACHEAEQPQHKFPLKRCDPALCTFCHQAIGGRPQAHAAIERGGCLACHNPHGSNTRFMLTGQDTAATCERCHRIERKAVLHGPFAVGDCTACHEPHEGDNRFRLVGGAGQEHCRSCHKGTAVREPGLPTVHPAVRQNCTPCHAPHSADCRFMLSAPADELCVTCHQDKRHLDATGHAPELLRAAGFEVSACRPCHWAHAQPETLQAALSWPEGFLAPGITGRVTAADRDCLICHRAGGQAPVPAMATHPDVSMFNPNLPADPGYLPLFDECGVEDRQGVLACRTCHSTHGRSTAEAGTRDAAAVSKSEQRARRAHLRPFTGGNVCTTCHSFDGRRRFLYFHDAARRGGPLTDQNRLLRR